VGLGDIVVWIIVGAIAGFLASKVLTGKGMGLIWDIVVGIVGAFVGGWLAGLAHISVTNIVVQIVVAFVGAQSRAAANCAPKTVRRPRGLPPRGLPLREVQIGRRGIIAPLPERE
jgi:uncharacterized membrane protein YeaQ/YmgE (transglycosylase-associated protein family)